MFMVLFILNSALLHLSNGNEEQPLVASVQETQAITSHRRASWLTQFKILSDRTFKNLYRNPMLMFTHYCISVYLACK